MKDFVALDFETANRERSSVCSIGLVFVENRQISKTYYQLIKPVPHFYSSFNTRIHGIIQTDTENAPDFAEVWQQVLPRITGLPIVAHNSPFDESCLKAVLAAYDLPLHTNRFFCTCRQARKVLLHLPDHKLGTVAEYLGIELNNHHHALADAVACAEIALRIFK